MMHNYTLTARYWQWIAQCVLPSANVTCTINQDTQQITIKIDY